MMNPFSTLEFQVEPSLQECLETEAYWFLIIFQVMEYLFIHNKMSWGWDSGLNMDLFFFVYIL